MPTITGIMGMPSCTQVLEKFLVLPLWREFPQSGGLILLKNRCRIEKRMQISLTSQNFMGTGKLVFNKQERGSLA